VALLIALHALWKISLFTIAAYSAGRLKRNNMGVTIVLLLLCCISLIVLIIFRILQLVVNESQAYIAAYEGNSFCMAIFALFTIATLSFFGVSLLLLLIHSARFDRPSKSLRRKVFVGATINGVGCFVGVLVLSYSRSYFALGLYVSCWCIFSWCIYRLLDLYIQKHFKQNELAPTNSVLPIIASSANWVLISMVCIVFTSAVYVTLWEVGRESRNRILLGPASTATIVGIFLSFLLLVHVLVNSLIQLSQSNRQQTEPAPDAPKSIFTMLQPHSPMLLRQAFSGTQKSPQLSARSTGTSTTGGGTQVVTSHKSTAVPVAYLTDECYNSDDGVKSDVLLEMKVPDNI
jgi:uncharacterized membrane protein